MRKSISIENIDNIDKFVGENFSPEQFIGDCLMEKSFDTKIKKYKQR